MIYDLWFQIQIPDSRFEIPSFYFQHFVIQNFRFKSIKIQNSQLIAKNSKFERSENPVHAGLKTQNVQSQFAESSMLIAKV